MKKIVILLNLLLLAFSLFAGEQTWTPLKTDAEKIVDIEVLASKDNLIDLEYSINGFYKEEVNINSKTYTRIIIPHEGIFLDQGYPELPHINRSILIPPQSNMEITITQSDFVEYENIDILPSKGSFSRNINPKDVPYTFDVVYNKDAWYPQDIAFTYDPYVMRDARGMVIQVQPFQYNPVQHKLRVYTNICINVSENGFSDINVKDKSLFECESVVESFLEVYKTQFINFEQSSELHRHTPSLVSGSMLIVTYDDFAEEMQPLLEWKNKKGIPTQMVNVSTLGNDYTTIKNYIQNLYDTWNLGFILLVGDAPQVTPYENNKDPLYACLEGEDYYPDVFIGRFSAEIDTHVKTQVDRVLYYESDPLISGDWIHKGTGVASDLGTGIGYNGWADKEMMDIIRDSLLAWNYTHIDQIYDPSGTASDVSNAINNGRSLVNYCGHGSAKSWITTGFSVSNINALTNNYMYPTVYCVACYNGNYPNITCFAEAWARSTNNTSGIPTGSIGVYASIISQDWKPPMTAQYHSNMFLKDELVTTLGNYFFSGAMQMMDEDPSGGTYEFKYWTVFGDPSVRLRTNTPMTLTVNHNPIIFLNSTTYDVEVVGVENALIGLYMNGTLYGYGYTDETGHATINLDVPLTDPGQMSLTVTAYNALPYSALLDAIVPVQINIIPDNINANRATNVTVTVLDGDGINPEVGVHVWAEGFGYTSGVSVTDTNGEAVLSINYPYGPSLQIFGKHPGEALFLFKETLTMNAQSLTNPNIDVTTNFGLYDSLAMNLEASLNQYCAEGGTMLWAKLNNSNYTSTTENSLPMIPNELGTVYAVISKAGYDLYEEEFPVIIACGTVSGTLTESENSNAISNAEVRFYEEGANPETDDPVFVSITDTLGSYTSPEEYAVDHYDIYINKWGFNPYQELSYLLGYGANTHNIVLDPAASSVVTGYVRDNAMITGATLSYVRSDNGEAYTSVQTDGGTYEVILPRFTYTVYVTAKGHVPYQGTCIVESDKQYNYYLGFAELFDDAEDSLSQWTSLNWDITDEEYVSPTHSFTDSPSGSYPPGTTATLQLNQPINLSSFEESVNLYFDAKWDTEPDFDYAQVQASTDGSIWTALEGEYTKPGTGSFQPNDEPVYNGKQLNWVAETSNLSDFAGQSQVYIRFLMKSDSYVSGDGIYVDNILVGDPSSSYVEPNFSNDDPVVVNQLTLNQNFPNPVRKSTTFSFALPQNIREAELSVYNIRGQLVKSFTPNLDEGPFFKFEWDGKDSSNKSVANGVYFYRLTTDKSSLTKKLLRLK